MFLKDSDKLFAKPLGWMRFFSMGWEEMVVAMVAKRTNVNHWFTLEQLIVFPHRHHKPLFPSVLLRDFSLVKKTVQ